MHKSVRQLILFSTFLITTMISAIAFAVQSPTVFVQNTSNQMLSELQKNQANLKTNPGIVYNIVHRILLPHADLATMSKMAVGRTAWLNASPTDRQAFIQQFTTNIIRTYAAALASYSNQTVQVFPIRGGWSGQSQVNVNTQIMQQDGPPIPVSYHLALQGGQWKVTDFSVEGVSLIQNYRAQFANALSSGNLASLTAQLSQHNASTTDS